MISFRDCTRELIVKEQLTRLRRLIQAGDTESLLVEAGMLEQGVVDALCVREDSWGTVQQMFRDLLLATGSGYVASRTGKAVRFEQESVLRALDTLERTELPVQVTARVPEGYLHYAIDPEDYARAAGEYVCHAGATRAEKAIVVGVRSIGTSLSGVVAAVTGSLLTLTLRPLGASGERRIVASEPLSIQMRGWIADGRDILIVDEGPGATGETLFCIGYWLRGLGARDSQIILFPSHTGGMGLAPQVRKDWFYAQRKYPPPGGSDRVNRTAAVLGFSVVESLSGGRWRDLVPGGASTPANVNHERLKYMARDASGSLYLLRYVGLGVWGEEAYERARSLASQGVGPEIAGFERGFMAYRWQDGMGARQAAVFSPSFWRAVAAYLNARWSRFGTGRAAAPESLIPALRENACEALGADIPGLAEAIGMLEDLPEHEAVIADARMRPVEWIEVRGGYVKVDAWEHGDGTRLPGPVDPAWDYAAASVEFGWGKRELGEILDRLPLQGSSRRELEKAVEVYRAPYAACCLGEADIAARETTDERDRQLLMCETNRYRSALQYALRQIRGRAS